ncbi:MAG: tryptophan-rich sensory protein [Alphaproteobacteria bacterium]|nr:tryptophan-rich sensory protein [Alphaproteobacteria bacterium]
MSFLDAPPGSRRPLYVFLILTLAVGAGASMFTTPQIPTWYASLNHPSITPPNYLFAPVWTTLYILMAIAAWLVWKKTGTRSVEMAAFALQLLLNFGWSLMFFALHSIGGALAEIIALDLAIMTTTILFFRRDRIAGLLFLPYLGWTAFATVLTHAFWRLN